VSDAAPILRFDPSPDPVAESSGGERARRYFRSRPVEGDVERAILALGGYATPRAILVQVAASSSRPRTASFERNVTGAIAYLRDVARTIVREVRGGVVIYSLAPERRRGLEEAPMRTDGPTDGHPDGHRSPSPASPRNAEGEASVSRIGNTDGHRSPSAPASPGTARTDASVHRSGSLRSLTKRREASSSRTSEKHKHRWRPEDGEEEARTHATFCRLMRADRGARPGNDPEAHALAVQDVPFERVRKLVHHLLLGIGRGRAEPWQKKPWLTWTGLFWSKARIPDADLKDLEEGCAANFDEVVRQLLATDGARGRLTGLVELPAVERGPAEASALLAKLADAVVGSGTREAPLPAPTRAEAPRPPEQAWTRSKATEDRDLDARWRALAAEERERLRLAAREEAERRIDASAPARQELVETIASSLARARFAESLGGRVGAPA